MRKTCFSKLLAALAAVTLVLYFAGLTQAESGCHKIKDKGKGTSTQVVQVLNCSTDR